MAIKPILTTLTLGCFVAAGFAADRNIPAGYYTPIDGKRDSALKTAVHNVIYAHTEVSSYQNLPQYFMRTDVYPESRQWWDMYGNEPFYTPSFAGLNREHSLPKSWWGGLTDIPAYVDLFHLYPSEAVANQAKSNYPLGTVDRSTKVQFDNGISAVGYPVTGQGGGAAYVFEPDDEYKGDFARTYFYMATCYQNLTWKYTYMLGNNLYPTLNSWSQELLLKWHRQDPVSQKEIDRNEVVYGIQANRNPFIDFPLLAEYIWGNRKGDAFDVAANEGGSTTAGTPTLITPVQGMELDFGQVALGRSGTAKLHLRGENLTGNYLTLSIYDNTSTQDANLFTVDGGQQRFSASVSAVNSADGLWVTVTYTPESVGSHSTRMVISGGGITGSLGIGLMGECLPMPDLTAPVATAASDVTEYSYTANWTPAPDEVVDYYIVNRTQYVGGVPTTEQLIAEVNSLTITDFCGSESYTVQSVRLEILSEPSNVIFVGADAIVTPEMQVAFGARPCSGGLLLSGSDCIGHLCVYDASGRLIMEIPDAANGDVVYLTSGVYILKADAAPAPVRAIVR